MRGYASVGYHQIKTAQGKVLCYHEMEKPLVESFLLKNYSGSTATSPLQPNRIMPRITSHGPA